MHILEDWRIRDVEAKAERAVRAFMSWTRSVAMWLVWNIPMGNLAPVLMGYALQSKPVLVASKRSKVKLDE